MSELDERRSGRRGDAAHETAALEQQVRMARQEHEEERYEKKREEDDEQ
ncbi:MAG: hypothetical protein WCA04_08830 [Geobacteraceae bacterium]